MAEIIINNEAPDTEKQIDAKMKDIEKKMKINQALGMLRLIDWEISDFDIDMTYDEKNDNFYFVSWNEKLNIPMKINQLEEIWNTMKTLLNNKNKLWITWKQDFRRIFEVKLFWTAKDNQVYYKWTKSPGNELNINDAIKNNNNVEELYRFTQILKNIPKNNWIIEGWIGNPDEIGNK